MKYDTPKPGTYRELFKRGLQLLLNEPTTTHDDREAAQHYLRLLDDPAYKFGRPGGGGGTMDYHHDLYFRS